MEPLIVRGYEFFRIENLSVYAACPYFKMKVRPGTSTRVTNGPYLLPFANFLTHAYSDRSIRHMAISCIIIVAVFYNHAVPVTAFPARDNDDTAV